MPSTDNRAKFDAFMKTKEVVAWLSEFPVEGTRTTYSSALFRYWNEYLSQKYPTLSDWIIEVKRQRKSDDMTTRKAWALDVLNYMKTRKGLGGRPMATASRELLSSAVKSFLRALADEEIDYDFKISSTIEELRKKQNRKALSVEEMRRLYEECKTTRDKALMLVAVNGVAPAEMIQFVTSWKEWFPKDPSKLTAPFKANLIRGKKSVPYHVTLFQDACQTLRDLYAERMLKTGGQVDALFVTDEGTPYTRKAYERFWENLRDRAGLANTAKWERQTAHPHAVRSFFTTQAKNHRVSYDVREYALGHSGDKYGYDRSAQEADWDKMVETDLAKMTDVLNLRTGMAQQYYQSKEDEFKARIAKDTYKTLIESGALKPETLTTPVLEVIAKRLGIKFETLVLEGEPPTRALRLGAMYEFKPGELDELEKLPPEEERKKVADLAAKHREKVQSEDRLRLFDMISTAVNLDTDVYQKYMDALKVMKPTTGKSAWENDDWYWMRVEVGSDDYMQALADHFEVVDKDDKMRILRKPKPSPSIEENTETRLGSLQ